MLNKPLVTIITVSFNSEDTIRDTIKAILGQTYSNVEYIIVDGMSNDNTIKVAEGFIEKFKKKKYEYKIISEKDRGLYDAMNKGIRLSNGEIIGILNSDDFYLDKFVIQKVVDKMLVEKADCLYADILYVDELDTNKIVRKWKAGKGNFKFGWNPPHPATFLRKEVYDKNSLYKVDYKISSDYDLLYRVIHKNSIKVTYFEEYIVKMRKNGISTRGLKSTIIGNKEVYKTLKENNQKYAEIIIFLRLFIKIKQFL